MSLSDIHESAGTMLEDGSAHVPPPREHDGVWVRRVSFERWPPGYSIVRTERDNVVLFYVIDGEGCADAGEGGASVGKETCILFAPGRPHRVVAETEMHLHRMTVEGARAADFAEKHLGNRCGVFRPGNGPEVAALFRQALEEGTAQRPRCAEMLIAYADLLLWTLRRGVAEAAAPHVPGVRLYRMARGYFDSADPARATVTQAARTCGCSPEHLARVFRKHAALSPQAYLLRRRMNRAAVLLTTTEQALAPIAAACGYSDEYAFSKAFKRFFGDSPGRWRRQ